MGPLPRHRVSVSRGWEPEEQSFYCPVPDFRLRRSVGVVRPIISAFRRISDFAVDPEVSRGPGFKSPTEHCNNGTDARVSVQFSSPMLTTDLIDVDGIGAGNAARRPPLRVQYQPRSHVGTDTALKETNRYRLKEPDGQRWGVQRYCSGRGFHSPESRELPLVNVVSNANCGIRHLNESNNPPTTFASRYPSFNPARIVV